jgi:hypothetical protein
MPYAGAVAVTATQLSRAGIVDTLPTTPTATDGNKVLFDPTMWLEVNNGSGAPINVTIDLPRTVDGQAVADPVVAVSNGVRKKIGPFTADYIQSDGYIWFTFSAVTTITIGAFRL